MSLRISSIIFIYLLGILFSVKGYAQPVSLSDTLHDFGEVAAYDPQQAEFILYNGQNQPLQILNVQHERVEYSTDLLPGVISPNGQRAFHVSFVSNHNLYFEDYLRIETDRGDRPLLLHLKAQTVYPGNYYTATRNQWDDQLKSALHRIIDGHTTLSYSALWDALAVTDEDPDNSNNVLLFYTGWSDVKTNHGGAVDEWNREHVWAKSHGDFGTAPPAGTDLHHIRPTDVSVNSRRGNLDFDDGGSLYIDPDGSTGCRVDDDSWEPRDAVKGDVARMMYYMTVRYEGDEGYDLELVENVPSTSTGQPLFGRQSTLYQWHWSDTVEARERYRNDIIYTDYQGNRNPFIDHPEFADRISDIHGGSDHLMQPEMGVSPAAVDLGTIGLNSRADYYIAVVNSGEAALEINSVSVNHSSFSVSAAATLIQPGQYTWITVSYQSGDREADDTAQLTILSNDADEGSLVLPIHVIVSAAVSIIGQPAGPANFRLEQNYPNPFNPLTNIPFTLPATEQVRLVIYDIHGRAVMTILEKLVAAGEHTVSLDGADLPSGIYFYSLITAEQTLTRRMLLLK